MFGDNKVQAVSGRMGMAESAGLEGWSVKERRGQLDNGSLLGMLKAQRMARVEVGGEQ